jgi:hypothetical protein
MSRTLTTRMMKSRNVKDSISEFQIPGVGDVKDTHNKNDEIAKCEIAKCQRLHFGVSDTGSWWSQESNSRQELAICEITKRSGPSNYQDCGPLI